MMQVLDVKSLRVYNSKIYSFPKPSHTFYLFADFNADQGLTEKLISGAAGSSPDYGEACQQGSLPR
jgi:hypothetical protein